MMRLRIAKNLLQPAVAAVARAVPARATTPIHTGMLATVADGTLTLAGYDPSAKVSVKTTVAVADAEDGTVLIPAHKLRDIVASLPGGDVQLAAEDGRVSIKAGRSAFSVPLMPVEDYPTLPQMPAAAGTLPAVLLAEMVAQTAAAADAPNSATPVLSGILVEATEKSLLMVATDRYRCAVREVEWEAAEGFVPFSAIIPAKTLSDVAKTLAKGADVTLAHSEGVLGLSDGSTASTVGEFGGDYPNWRGLFAQTGNRKVTVDARELSESVALVSTIKEQSTPVRLKLTDGAVHVSANSSAGDGVDVVDAVLEGEELELGINPDFLRDGIVGAGAGKLTLELSEANRPLILTGEGVEGYRYLVMPQKLN